MRDRASGGVRRGKLAPYAHGACSRGLAERRAPLSRRKGANGMDASHPLIPEVGRVEVDPRGPTASKCQVGRASSSQANRRARDEDLPASALPQRRERGIAGAGRREPGPRRRLPDAAGGRARSADDGSLHGPGSGGVLCKDRRHDAVGEHPAAPDPEHARMLGEPRPGDAGQHP